MIEFFAAGIPQSQGSTRAFVVKGRAVTTSANAKNKSWREHVHSAFEAHCDALLEPPIRVELEFVMPRTQSLPKTKVRPHTTTPDLDKLVRSCLDAGTGVAWGDDARVNRIFAAKRYADVGEQPGVHVMAMTDPHTDASRRFQRVQQALIDYDRLRAEVDQYRDATHCPWCGLRLRELFHDGFCNRPPMWKGFNPEPRS